MSAMMPPKQLGDFLLEKRIGQGGMGEVYRARQLSLDRTVAVKLLPRSLAAQESFIERFQREAKAAANLIHPNVIQIYSIGVEQGIPYFAMEYIEGEDLQQRMRRLGRLSFEESADIITGVTNALAVAFEKGIVHRDIKPSNIMIDKNGVVKVMDFGLAKATQDPSTNLTAAGLIMGTPNYISPEQARGDDTIDSRSDMYSLGIVFYELATGALPFRADTPAALIYKHAFEEPEPPTKLSADVPPFLEEIILRMIAKEPGNRYPNPKALLTDLNEFKRNAEHYLRGGQRRTPAVDGGDSGVHHDRTLIDAHGSRGGSRGQGGTSSFQRAQTLPENTTNATLVDTRPRRSSAVSALLLLLVVAVAGGVAVFVIGPDRVRQMVLGGGGGPGGPIAGGQGAGGPGQQGGASGQPGSAGGQSGSNGSSGGSSAETQGMALFPGASLRGIVPESVNAYLIKEGQPFPLTFADFAITPGRVVLRFDKRGYKEILVTTALTTSPDSASVILQNVQQALANGFQLADLVQSQYDQGLEALREKQLEVAVRLFSSVMQSAPDFEPARKSMEDAKREQREISAVFDRGQTLHDKRRWEEAISELRKVPRTAPEFGAAAGLVSSAETELRGLEDLRAVFRRQLEEGSYGAGEATVRAIEENLPSGAPEPESLRAKLVKADNLLKRGKAEFAAEQYEDAIKAFEELALLSPRHEELVQGGMLFRSRDILKERAQSDSAVKGGLDTARAHLDAGRFAEAIAAGEAVLQVERQNATAAMIIDKARAGVAESEVRAAVAELDVHFKGRRFVEILERTDAGSARANLERQLKEFFAAPIVVSESEHTDVHVVVTGATGSDPRAEIECWWKVTLSFPALAHARSYRPGSAASVAPGPVQTTQSRQVRQRIKLRKADRWLFTGFEQVTE